MLLSLLVRVCLCWCCRCSYDFGGVPAATVVVSLHCFVAAAAVVSSRHRTVFILKRSTKQRRGEGALD